MLLGLGLPYAQFFSSDFTSFERSRQIGLELKWIASIFTNYILFVPDIIQNNKKCRAAALLFRSQCGKMASLFYQYLSIYNDDHSTPKNSQRLLKFCQIRSNCSKPKQAVPNLIDTTRRLLMGPGKLPYTSSNLMTPALNLRKAMNCWYRRM